MGYQWVDHQSKYWSNNLKLDNLNLTNNFDRVLLVLIVELCCIINQEQIEKINY